MSSAAGDRITSTDGDVVDTDLASPASPSDDVMPVDEPAPTSWSKRLPVIVFGLYLAIAFVVLLRGPGAHYWFAADEITMLVANDPGSMRDLFEPENLHWSTLLILAYGGLYKLFGLRSYVPYQAVVIVLHLTLAVQIRMVMRRATVAPWIATAAAASFVLFGPGEQNILSAIQISMVGSMVLGFAHLMLADHDGRPDRRDALGLVCGALGLMASGVGPTLVIIVGISAMIRRGWRMAALHTAPLAAMYGIWWFTQRATFEAQSLPTPTVWVMGRWVVNGEWAVFESLGHYPVIEIMMATMLAVGLVLAWRPLPMVERRKVAAAPLALFLGALLLFALVAFQRAATGDQWVRSSRYLSMASAFTLPVLAVAADGVARRWPPLLPVVMALFLIPIPANLERFEVEGFPSGVYSDVRQVLLAAAYSPHAEETSPELVPYGDPFRAPLVTIGFLLEARDSGRLPPAPEVSAELAREIEVRLGIQQVEEPMPPGSECEERIGPVVVEPALGERLRIQGPIDVTSAAGWSRPVRFQDQGGGPTVLEVELPDLQLVLTPVVPARYTLCRAAP